ncbi:MAG: histidine--tRNA ligase [Peptococcaceae bacterium]|nr:histidine--tRNA ligase [Peptococcaceae bacterium]
MITKPRGTNDIIPGEIEIWQFIESTFRQVCRDYGYEEIRTPVFEHTELFLRGVGDTTDIVDKEMYTFQDRGDRSLTLRPEGTAPTVRAFLENKLQAGPQPVKLFYWGPMFRYDRPQAGRYRQFHQCGVEVFSAADPAIDAEVIMMSMDYYRRLGLDNLALHINSVGCPRCRPVLHEKLREYFSPHLDELCHNCRTRYEKNPLRLLDCKICEDKHTEDIPTTLNSLCNECLEHFEAVKTYLDLLNLPYHVNNHLVRGLDYYTNTAFEITASHIGAQSSIGGGGRYNGLVEVCGGPPTPGIGYALGLERIILTMREQGCPVPATDRMAVFVVNAGKAAEKTAFKLMFEIRQAGIPADKDFLNRSMKAQMKYAGRINARFVVIIGDEELAESAALVRNMDTKEQTKVPFDQLIPFIKDKY